MFTPYFNFNQNASEAIETYIKAFNATVGRKMQYKDMPPHPDFPIAPEQMGWILHAELNINGHSLLISDVAEYSTGNHMKVNITGDEAFLKHAWDVLKEDATNIFELAPAFFSPLHGALTDKFGINWAFTAPPVEQKK